MTAHPRLTLAPLLGLDRDPYVAPRMSVRAIAAQVSAETGVPVSHIYGRRRLPHIVRARWAVWAKARAQGLSLTQIGHATGHDHTTVLHGLRRMEEARGQA